MFHAKDGWYFERIDTGSVRIKVEKPGYPTTATVELSADTWASVVAAVSARGDIAQAWQEALDLHNRR
jgi:hypothetical protein